MFRNDDRSERQLIEIAARHAPRGGVWAIWHGKPLRRVQWTIDAIRYRWPHRNLFVAGLPKSGTTWLERMLTSVPGYRKWIPGYIAETGQDLLPGTLTHPPPGYTVTRVHTQPRPRNVALVHETNRPYVVLLRDLRDVTVSYYFYARNHPDVLLHAEARETEISEFIHTFIDRMLPDYIRWCTGWVGALHPARGRLCRYETLLSDTRGELSALLDHFGIDLPGPRIDRIVRRHQFRRETGRAPGDEDPAAFNRKGVAGDWRRHFSAEHRARFAAMAGEMLGALGYTPD